MVLLEVTSKSGSRIYNLDHIQMVEFEQDSLDFWVSEKLSRNIVKLGSAAELRKRFKAAIVPIYEGRMNNVMGISLSLDISDLQDDRVPF